MYQLKFSEKEKEVKRSKLERYQDLLLTLRLFPSAPYCALLGLSSSTTPDLNQLLKKGRKKEHIDAYFKGRFFYTITEKGKECNNCWFTYLKEFDLQDIVGSNFAINLNSFIPEDKRKCFSVEEYETIKSYYRRGSELFFYLNWLKFLSLQPGSHVRQVMNNFNASWGLLKKLRKIGKEKGHVQEKESKIGKKLTKIQFFLTEKGLNCIKALDSYIFRYNLADLL